MMGTAAEGAWRAFRAAREAELVQPYGWLTLQGFHWLPERPSTLAGLPGRWWTDGQEAFLEATAADGLGAEGRMMAGRSAKTVAETSRSSWVRWGDTEIELLRRGGRFAIRLRAATSPERENFDGVPTFDYDQAWIIQGDFRALPEGDRLDVATCRPELRQRLPAVGEVRFEIDGQPQRLIAISIKTGPSIEFHDPTNDDETEAWRQLKFDWPDETGHVLLDFNRTINMWFAFTDHATCPKPTESNVITVPVRAGEKRVHSPE